MSKLSISIQMLDRRGISSESRDLEIGSTRDAERQHSKGLWRSERGSLYAFDGQTFVCISVYSDAFQGWIGKVAVRDVYESEGVWYGWQAFRNRRTGELGGWCRIRLMLSENQVTKVFPAEVPSDRLVNGRIETLDRVQQH